MSEPKINEVRCMRMTQGEKSFYGYNKAVSVQKKKEEDAMEMAHAKKEREFRGEDE